MSFQSSITPPFQKTIPPMPKKAIPPMPKVNEVEFEVCDVSVEMVVVDSEDGKVPVIVSEEKY